jgi:hypothetical protein
MNLRVRRGKDAEIAFRPHAISRLELTTQGLTGEFRIAGHSD